MSKQGLDALEITGVSNQVVETAKTFSFLEIMLFFGSVIAVGVSIINLVHFFKLVDMVKEIRSPYDDVAIEIQRWSIIFSTLITITCICLFIIGYRLLEAAIPSSQPQNTWLYIIFVIGFIAVILIPIIQFVSGLRSVEIMRSRGANATN